MQADAKLWDRAVWRIMPLATLSFMAAIVDKSNIGFAKLQMLKSLGMSEAAFAFGSSLFFVAFMVFEVPSALAAHRFGARKWTARIMATWGLITIALAFTPNEAAFYGLRLALGVAEARLYPTLIYYLTLWFPQSQQPRVMGFLTLGSAIGNGGGALLSGALLDLNGAAGLEGWQWVFLITGVVPLIVAALVLRFMPDTPAQADFLSSGERKALVEAVARDRPAVANERGIFALLVDPRVLGYTFVYMLLGIALFGVIYWTPTAIRGFAVSGSVNGMLTAAPWAVTCLLLLTLPPRLKSRAAVLRAWTAISVFGASCFAVAAIFAQPELRYAALFFGTPCISLSIALFWTFPVRLFDGAKAAACIAGINVFGNVGGFIGQNLMPAVALIGHNPAFAMWVPSACLAAIGVGTIVLLYRSYRDIEKTTHATLLHSDP